MSLHYITEAMYGKNIGLLITDNIRRCDYKHISNTEFVSKIYEDYKKIVDKEVNYKNKELNDLTIIAKNALYPVIMKNFPKLLDTYISEYIHMPSLPVGDFPLTQNMINDFPYSDVIKFIISYRFILKINDLQNPQLEDYISVFNQFTDYPCTIDKLKNRKASYRYSKTLLKPFYGDLRNLLPPEPKKGFCHRLSQFFMNLYATIQSSFSIFMDDPINKPLLGDKDFNY